MNGWPADAAADIGTRSRQDWGMPLSNYPLFESRNLEQTRELVSSVFCQHDLRITGRNQTLDARMYHAPIGGFSLSRLQYGADVAIDPGNLGDFLLVQMPLKGRAEICSGRNVLHSHPQSASVTTPAMPLKMWWSSDCDKLVVRISRDELERHCAQHIGRPLSQPVEFELGMDLTKEDGRNWLRIITFLVGELNMQNNMILNSPMIRAQRMQFLVTTLLLCQPSNYREMLLRPAPTIRSHYVKRVEEYIDSHADQPITIIDLASYAGVSTRALYKGFRNLRNTTPMTYLKEVRLNRVRDDLLRAGQNERVTTIAIKWGFTHLSNFTADYKRKFGELPSDTLKC